jgi:hypothetical protein
MKIYHKGDKDHPKLPDGQNVAELPDTEDAKATLEILKKSGWTDEVPKALQDDDSANAAGNQGGK